MRNRAAGKSRATCVPSVGNINALLVNGVWRAFEECFLRLGVSSMLPTKAKHVYCGFECLVFMFTVAAIEIAAIFIRTKKANIFVLFIYFSTTENQQT